MVEVTDNKILCVNEINIIKSSVTLGKWDNKIIGYPWRCDFLICIIIIL